MIDLNKEREVNLRFEKDDAAVWVFDGDNRQGTEISHLMMMHADEYSEDELRVICHHAACEIDRLRAELEKAKAQAVPEWISVDDKWPEYGQSILVVINGLTQTRVFYRDGSDCSEDWIEPVNDEDKNNIWWNKVTFWMPLPKAPSESGAEG